MHFTYNIKRGIIIAIKKGGKDSMKLFDRIKKRRHLELNESEDVTSNELSKTGKKEMKFSKPGMEEMRIAESFVEENEGNIQFLGERDGVIYLISNLGTKDIKYKKSYIRHIGYFEKGCEGRVLNMFFGVSSSNKLNEMTEDDILFSKEIMGQLLVSSFDIGTNFGQSNFTIYAPTDIEDIINYKCDDKRVEKAVRNIGKKLSEMSEEERFILYFNCIGNIFESDDRKTTYIVDNAINKLLENKINGMQYESKMSIKQKEKEEKKAKINFKYYYIGDKLRLKNEIEDNTSFHSSDFTLLISPKTGDKICLSTFPIKDVEYDSKSNMIKLFDNMFNEEKIVYAKPYREYKTEYSLYSLLDINSLIKTLKYAIKCLYIPQFDEDVHRKGYYSIGPINEKLLNIYNKTVTELKKIKTREDYIEFYIKYMNELIDHIIEKYGIDDEYQLHILDQFMEKSMAEINKTSEEIPYDSIRKLRTFTKDELKDIFYRIKNEARMKENSGKLSFYDRVIEKTKSRKEEIIRKQKEERIKEKISIISGVIARKISFKHKMTIDDIKTEIIKYDPKFTAEELVFCTRLVLEKSAQILNPNKRKVLRFKR